MSYVFISNNPFVSVNTSSVSGSMSAITQGIALPANVGRTQFYIQVVGSGSPLYVAFNGQPASATNFNLLLKAATSDPGADGGTFAGNGYTGPVGVSGGIGCRFVAWQNGISANPV